MSANTITTPMSQYFPSSSGAGTTVNIDFSAKDDATNLPRFALGYWSIRGLGAPLTMMLCAAKKDFTLYLYDLVEKEGDEGGWESSYFKEKESNIQTYEQPLWNLPFVVDRQTKQVICQTNACFAYVGRHCGMFGSDEKSTSQCEELLCEVMDLRNIMTTFCYSGADNDAEKEKESAKQIITSAKKHFQKFEQWLELQAKMENSRSSNESDDASNKKKKVDLVHLVDGKFSAPDFHLYEMLDQYDAFATHYEAGDCFSNYPRLRAFKEGFELLEENQFYLKSWLHTDLPFNNCIAKFGSLPGPRTYQYGKSVCDAKWRNRGSITLDSTSPANS